MLLEAGSEPAGPEGNAGGLVDPRRASRLGRPVRPRELPHVDLIVAGSVAVNRKGVRVGKGGGYSDLEYAIGRQVGAIDAKTVVATTVHPLQLVGGVVPGSGPATSFSN